MKVRHKQPVILRLLIWVGLFLAALTLSAAPLKLDSLRVGSRVYKNVTIVGANETDLYFTYDGGIGNVKLRSVDQSLRQRFNYDPKIAAEAERLQAADDTAYQSGLAEKIAMQAQLQAQKVALAAKNASNTSEDSMADPISDKSLIGKPVPDLAVEKWLTDQPVLTNKPALISFWAPWSIPCRKAIVQFNALHKKFGEKLVIVGITSESQEDVEGMTEPKIEFAYGIDPKARLSAAAGISSIPCVLFLDAKGVVRYQGHPAALDEKKLESLLAKPVE